jgi:hypothetical protein
MTIEPVVCPTCGGTTAVNSVKPPSYSSSIESHSACPNCGHFIIVRVYSDGGRQVTAELRKEPAKCHVVTAIYGAQSKELRRARIVCTRRFALNPWVTPSWILYKLLGPVLALAVTNGAGASKLVDFLFARPIILASDKRLSVALLPILYLGLWGWVFVSSVAYLFAAHFAR